jgi:hypothetical protein
MNGSQLVKSHGSCTSLHLGKALALSLIKMWSLFFTSFFVVFFFLYLFGGMLVTAAPKTNSLADNISPRYKKSFNLII